MFCDSLFSATGHISQGDDDTHDLDEEGSEPPAERPQLYFQHQAVRFGRLTEPERKFAVQLRQFATG